MDDQTGSGKGWNAAAVQQANRRSEAAANDPIEQLPASSR